MWSCLQSCEAETCAEEDVLSGFPEACVSVYVCERVSRFPIIYGLTRTQGW